MTTLFGKDRVQYNGQVRKYTALFGSLFSDMHILRKTSEVKTDLVRVPIKYGPGFIYNKTEPIDGKSVKVNPVYPAMAFELVSLAKDPSRMVNQNTRIRKGSPEPGNYSEKFAKAPVPYDIRYKLTIRTLNIEDLLMILEQITAVFNPQVSLYIVDNNSLGLERDVTIRLESDTYDFIDNYEDSQEETRMIDVTLEFVVKGYMYKYEELKPVAIGIQFDPDTGTYEFPGTAGKVTDYTQTAAIDNIGTLISASTGE